MIQVSEIVIFFLKKKAPTKVEAKHAKYCLQKIVIPRAFLELT